MSVIRVGSNGTYAEGWDKVFGGSKAKGGRKTAKKSAKKASPKTVVKAVKKAKKPVGKKPAGNKKPRSR